MKRIIPFSVCLVVGVIIGWYFGYTRPTAERQRELLKHYQTSRDDLNMTDADMAEAGPKIPQYFEDMKRQDEQAARVALGAYRYLERGQTDESKQRLVRAIGSYYRLYHAKGGDTNLLAEIKKTAQEHPALAAELARKLDGKTK